MDKASFFQRAGRLRVLLVRVLALAAGFFHLYTGCFGLYSATVQRATHWLILGCLAFLLYPAGVKEKQSPSALLWDAACFTLMAGAGIYLLLFWQDFAFRVMQPGFWELFWGGAMLLFTLEAGRRCSGFFLPLTAMVFLLYAYVGPYLPGVLRHKGYGLSRVLSYLYTTSSGIYGLPLGISSTFIILFILFGAFLSASGAGQLFIESSFALTRRFTGGAAKTAVVSSALMGTISGSPIANAVTTGTFTIPLMRRSGYSADMACAVEAVSSTGGMLMPPVMGAAAFIMAEYLNISYFDVAKAAFLPALIYFASVYFMVDLYARKHNVRTPEQPFGGLGASLRRLGHLALPLVCLIVFLCLRYPPLDSVVWSLLLLLGVSWLRKETRITPARFAEALEIGVRNAVPVACACATAGIILGVVSLTGLGSALSSAALGFFSQNLRGALVAVMFMSLVLGMGLPATAVYLILASLAAPILVKLGVLPLAAHMFVFYFGIISTITPPVALTAYAAAGVGGGEPTRVGIIAFCLGVAAYIIPFILVYAPSLMLVGSIWEGLVRFAISLVAVYAIALATMGHLRRPMRRFSRFLAAVGGLLLIAPTMLSDLLGAGLVGAVLMYEAQPDRPRGM